MRITFTVSRTCLATSPPISSLSLIYLSTVELRKMSKSWTDSGRDSAEGFAIEAEIEPRAGGGGDVEVAEASAGDEADLFIEGVVSLGSSVDVAMSSSRDVAASRLRYRARCKQKPDNIKAEVNAEDIPLYERREVVHVVRGRHGGLIREANGTARGSVDF